MNLGTVTIAVVMARKIPVMVNGGNRAIEMTDDLGTGLPVTTDTIDDLKIPLIVVVAVEAIRTVTTITTRRGGAVDIRPVAGTAPIGETHVHPAGPDIPKKEIPPTMDGSTLLILLPLQDPWIHLTRPE